MSEVHPIPHGHAILLAAGQGRRFGASAGKGFTEIHGRPLLSWSLATFAAHPQIESIIVIVPPWAEGIERTRRDLIEPMGLGGRVILASGGDRRQDSSQRGIDALPASIRSNPDTIVLIHDAARPMVSSFLITRCLRALADFPDAAGVLPALPVRETLKKAADAWVERTVDREGLWAAQTPQVFRLGPLRAAQAKAVEQEIAVTDDASLLEAIGERLRIVPGDIENIKVTYPEDRILVERLLRARES
jgi:2-C-methyl-D-erythritol 4-phosphate cytidylyltransferase